MTFAGHNSNPLKVAVIVNQMQIFANLRIAAPCGRGPCRDDLGRWSGQEGQYYLSQKHAHCSPPFAANPTELDLDRVSTLAGLQANCDGHHDFANRVAEKKT